MHESSWITTFIPLLSGFLGVAFGAGITYHFNSKLLEKSHTREDEQYIANIFGQFCDDLTELSMSYWTSEVTRENSDEMLLLGSRISAYHILMSKFLLKNFPNNNDMLILLSKTNRATTGYDFPGRKADVDRAAKAVAAIIDLKMTVAQVVKIK